MKRKRFSLEQVVAVLKQAEVGVPAEEVCRLAEITEQTFYRWKKMCVGLEVHQVQQLKQLQEENARLKKLVAELSLDETMLQEVLSKNCEALATPPGDRVPVRGVPGKPASRLPGRAGGGIDLPLPEPPATEILALCPGQRIPESGLAATRGFRTPPDPQSLGQKDR